MVCGLQKSRFDFKAVKGFVPVELRLGYSELAEVLVEVRKRLWLFAGRGEPDFLGFGEVFADKSQCASVADRKRRRHGVRNGDVLAGAGGFVADQLAGKAVRGEQNQGALLGPTAGKDGPVKARCREIFCGRHAR